jgi:hypothetical protein
MKRILAFIVATALVPVSANADFSVSKPKPAKTTPVIKSPKHVAKPRRPVVVAPRPQLQPQPLGIDPATVREAILAAGYQTNLSVSPTDGSTRIDVASGTSAWSVFMKECRTPNQCRAIEYGLEWSVPNDANICNSWTHYITQDEGGKAGFPVCTAVPPSGKQLRLSLSSDQGPYAGIDKAPKAEAKDRLISMAKVWTSYVGRLSEARDIANKKCPKKKNSCW